MKKKLLGVVLVLGIVSTILSACGSEAVTTDESVNEQVVKEVIEEPEEVAETPYLEDVTFATGKEFEVPFGVATCDEEGEPLEYKGVEATQAENEKVVIDSVTVTDDPDDADCVDVEINMTQTCVYRLTVDYYEYDDEEFNANCQVMNFLPVDYYSGLTLPYLTYEEREPGYDYTQSFTYNGKTTDISYSVVQNIQVEMGDWEADENDTEFRYEFYDTTYTYTTTMYLKMPKDYDGLVLALKDNKISKFDKNQYYEFKVDDQRKLFDADEAGDTSTATDYIFVRLEDIK